jgi:hypothetical protein
LFIVFFVCSGSNELFGWQQLFVKVTNNPTATSKQWIKKLPDYFSNALHRFSDTFDRFITEITDNPQLNVVELE